VIDASFISLKIVVPATIRHLGKGSFILALIKPQFEAGKGMVVKGGLVRDEDLQKTIITDLSISSLTEDWVFAEPLNLQSRVQKETESFSYI